MKFLKFHLSIALSAISLVTVAPLSQAVALDLNPLTAIKGLIEAAVEDRSTEDIAKDAEIRIKITADVIDKMGTDVISLNADVYEQDVMLSGTVDTEDQRELAEAITGTIKGVKKIHNVIMIQNALDEEKGSVENFIDDSIIETKINALLLDARGVNVTNFRWRSVGGHVFLFGKALSSKELKKAIRIVKDIKGVVDVKSLAKVSPDMP